MSNIDKLIKNNACVIKALAEGLTIKKITNSRSLRNRARTKISNVANIYGPQSKKVQDAIDEANRISIIATSARAAIARIKRKVAKAIASGEKPKWKWSMPKFYKYRELQNIPTEWNAKKIVLIWYSVDRQELRIFSEAPGNAYRELIGPGVYVLKTFGNNRSDYKLTRKQYDEVT